MVVPIMEKYTKVHQSGRINMKNEYVKISRKHIDQMVKFIDSSLDDKQKLEKITDLIVSNYSTDISALPVRSFKVGDVVKIIRRNIYKDFSKEYVVVTIKTRLSTRGDGSTFEDHTFGLIGVEEMVEMDFESNYTATPHRWFHAEHLRFVRSNPRCIKNALSAIKNLHRKPTLPNAPSEGTIFVNMPQHPAGEPCDHPGCLSHQSHPCEGCGRTSAEEPIKFGGFSLCEKCLHPIPIADVLKPCPGCGCQNTQCKDDTTIEPHGVHGHRIGDID